MSDHECTQMEKIGKFPEFMDSVKGLRPTIYMITLAILLQVGTFLYLWGGLTTTVQGNVKSIERILTKLDNIKIVGYAYANGGSDNAGERAVNTTEH